VNSVQTRFKLKVGEIEWSYSLVGNLLFLVRPGVRELVALCPSIAAAHKLAIQHVTQSTGSECSSTAIKISEDPS
jgi:hypothetical protein